MRRASHLVAAATVVAALVWGYRALFPSDERLIRRELADLVESANAVAIDDGVARLAAAARVGQHFTPDATVDFGPPYGRLDGRDRLVAFAAAGHGTSWRVEIARVQVVIDAAQSARVRLTATVTNERPDGGIEADARELALGLRRVERRWLIAQFEAFLRDGSSRLSRHVPLRLGEQPQRIAFGRAGRAGIGSHTIHR